MAFKSIHNNNPFVLPSILLGVFLYCKYYFSRHPGRFRPFFSRIGTKSTAALSVVFLCCLMLVPVFEAYFTIYRCQVSSRYYEENVELARNAIAVFQKYRLPFWLDYATLLCYLRDQEINPWDHDVDLSTIHPAYLPQLYKDNVQLLPDGVVMETVNAASTSSVSSSVAALASNSKRINVAPADSVLKLQELFEKEGLKTSWDEERDLFQVWSSSGTGPHIDLWLWRPAHSLLEDNDGPYPSSASLSYSSRDHTIAYNMRTTNDLFPLKNATWLGVPVYVPNDSHHVSHLEFDHYGGSYMESQVFRGDCFHNFFNARFAY